jgi:hypothetical protein
VIESFILRGGRGKFSEVIKIPFGFGDTGKVSWNCVRYLTFECPEDAFQEAEYEDRYKILLRCIC